MNKPESPLELAKWAKQSVEARLQVAGNSSSNHEIDPRISQERRLQLIHAFNDIDRDGSGNLSYEEIFNYLKDLNENTDENYIKAIFNSMDENHDSQVSIEEFISTYLNQVNALSEAASFLRLRIQECKRDLLQCQPQLEEAAKSERINSWGIMEGSLLTLRVVEAQNLSTLSGNPSSYVNILCEKQQIATKVVQNERNPTWNEEFSFKVAAGNGEMLIQIFHKSSLSKDDLLGFCSVPLDEFRDQAKHEKWFHLSGKTNTARVLLSVQWIHRKTQYLRERIETLQKEIETSTLEQTKIQEEMMKLGTNPSGMFKKESWVDRLEVKVVSEIQELPDTHFLVRNKQKLGSLESAQIILVVVFTVLTLLASLKRPDLGNLTWTGLFWTREICGWTIQTYRYAVGGLMMLVLSDFFWVFLNFEYLVFSVHQDQLENLHRFCFLVSFFSLILKVILSILIVKNYIKFKEMDILRVFNR